MKHPIIILLVFVIGLSSFTRSNKEENPPGTVKIGENLYFDKTEVRNIDWLEYVYWNEKIYGKESSQYLSSLPDTVVWRTEEGYNEPLVKWYFRHPSYRLYPLVGISYEQAVAYCDWRSDRVNEGIYRKNNKLDISQEINKKEVSKIYKYRLPTKKEWKGMAEIGYSKKVHIKADKEKNIDKPRFNLNSNDPCATHNKFITIPAGLYWANEIGCYNLYGNVAEMIEEKGIAMGGGWIHAHEEVDIQKGFNYEKPTNWLGFRCICEKVDHSTPKK